MRGAARHEGTKPAPLRLPALALALAFAAQLAVPALAEAPRSALHRGDAAWERRAEGSDGDGRASRAPIARAIEGYEAAAAEDPEALAPRWKLVRALYFDADFASGSPGEAIRQLDRATREADAALDLLAAQLGVDGSLDSFAPERLASTLSPAARSDAAALFFWSSVAWGAWGQLHGAVDAVRSGVAGRLYHGALAAAALDDSFEEGGAHRLLARIHAQVPRIPFLSGFVDRSRAVPAAERALAIAPGNPGNRYLLALTLLDVAPERREDALRLLEDAAVLEPRSEQLVEDLAMRRAARERLAEERGVAQQLAQEAAGGG
jgi:TRAP transporter TatT component family protein